jgi:hypothetical protein
MRGFANQLLVKELRGIVAAASQASLLFSSFSTPMMQR